MDKWKLVGQMIPVQSGLCKETEKRACSEYGKLYFSRTRPRHCGRESTSGSWDYTSDPNKECLGAMKGAWTSAMNGLIWFVSQEGTGKPLSSGGRGKRAAWSVRPA